MLLLKKFHPRKLIRGYGYPEMFKFLQRQVMCSRNRSFYQTTQGGSLAWRDWFKNIYQTEFLIY